ncbi:TPM domain-containing protein [Corynebacterium sp. Marseille-Q2516]
MRVLASLGAGAAVLLSAPLSTAAPSVQVIAEPPEQTPQSVIDTAGVLTDAQVTQFQQRIADIEQSQHRSMKIIFVRSFDGKSAAAWTSAFMTRNGGNNLAVLAVAVKDRQMGVRTGDQWSGAEQSLHKAAAGPLNKLDFAGAADAFLSEAESTDEISGESVAWLGGGAVAVVAAGGGLWGWARHKRRKDEANLLDDARRIDPTDEQSLAQLPTSALEELARDAIVATDESIRRGSEELDLATSEFGTERTRPFTKALSSAQDTMRKAYVLQDRLYDAIPETEPEKRSMFLEIITSCGRAQQVLNEQSESFTSMRDLLINADSSIDAVTRRTVDLRARLPQATQTLEALKQRYDASVVASIADNPELATASLDEAETHLSAALELKQRPAGQQGGLVEEIRQAERAVEVADSALSAVEHADDNIAAAREQIDALMAEIDQEISEAEDLRSHGTAAGAPANWQELTAVVETARAALESARATHTTDPLGAFTQLTDVDAQLDAQLDTVRDTTAQQDRLLAMYDKQFSAARNNIQAAEDLIASRGQIIGARARTYLSEAKELANRAHQLHDSDLRQAIDAAHQSAQRAQLAAKQAQRDIDEYRRRTMRNNSGGGSGLLTGMMLGSILSSGGGFSGGSF